MNMKKSSRSQFLEIVNAHLSLRDQGKKYDPSMVKVAEGIKDSRLQLADAAYYSIKYACLLYTSPSPRDRQKSRMPSSA